MISLTQNSGDSPGAARWKLNFSKEKLDKLERLREQFAGVFPDRDGTPASRIPEPPTLSPEDLAQEARRSELIQAALDKFKSPPRSAQPSPRRRRSEGPPPTLQDNLQPPYGARDHGWTANELANKEHGPVDMQQNHHLSPQRSPQPSPESPPGAQLRERPTPRRLDL